MSNQRGYYIEWTTKDGNRQKGAVYYHDQTKEFTSVKKLLIRLVDDKFEKTGVVTLKTPALVKIDMIGFFD